ncbi:SMP-30/gluconolactonase/LRE family protein [Sphingobacterium sp. WQ 366]|uniref:SMP-30/gluconolactonase/LRE family protein n=2 Tax=Sphingobacterium bovistauri TaxID=2781959 RepID=A0ABS7Z6Z9_9SPHI|nr:SMP-30/gluconolactonase/LRE family protein [Sphingobacterium bovistauri]
MYAQNILRSEPLKIEIHDAELRKIVDSDAKVEVLVEGLRWTEGPLWVEREKMLLFSEIPSNTVYKWTYAKGLEIYLRPSGYTGTVQSPTREPGSNGLILDNKGNLVLCQHGDRCMAKMEAALNTPKSQFVTLVDRYNKLRLNSPNDAVYDKKGNLYFTDPPYGLPTQGDSDPSKEIDFNGVFVLTPKGKLNVLSKELTRPNGIAVFSSTKKVLVANSDPKAPIWYLLDPNKLNQKPQIFYNPTNELKGEGGLPDGLKISKKEFVFASGPGGVWIFDHKAKLLGRIRFNSPVSNVALSDDENFLYLTNTGRIVRIPLN